jgi:hypothetical protein
VKLALNNATSIQIRLAKSVLRPAANVLKSAISAVKSVKLALKNLLRVIAINAPLVAKKVNPAKPVKLAIKT